MWLPQSLWRCGECRLSSLNPESQLPERVSAARLAPPEWLDAQPPRWRSVEAAGASRNLPTLNRSAA